jgi:hypothetical protein
MQHYMLVLRWVQAALRHFVAGSSCCAVLAVFLSRLIASGNALIVVVCGAACALQR